jgi:hypothetical protein
MVAITRRRRPRHTRLARLETDSKLYEWLAARAATAANGGIGDTAAAKTFTATAGTEVCASTAHGFNTGDAVVVSNSGGALPGGLAAATIYFVSVIDANSFYLTASVEKLRNAGYVDITSAGTGTQTALRVASVAGMLAWMKRGKKPEYINALTDIDNI